MAGATETVTIEKLVEGGWGLARSGSQVLFVRGVLPSERASVIDQVAHKGYREARLQGVLEPSPDRVEPPCPVYGVCGGCQLQHIRYGEQLNLKAAVLKETLSRVGKIEVNDVPPPVASEKPYHYRSTVRFAVSRDNKRFKLGFHQEGTNQPVEASGCLLGDPGLTAIALEIEDRLDRTNRVPLRLDSIEIRRSVATGSALLVHRTGPAVREAAEQVFRIFEGIAHVVGQTLTSKQGKSIRRWVHGEESITDQLAGLTFRIGDRSFMQGNWLLAGVLSRTIADWVNPSPGLRVLELYAGIGIFGLPLARRGALVTEVESNPYALADARHAARMNHIGRCRFRQVPAEVMLERVTVEDYDVVLMDPPRTGLSRACVDGLTRLGFPRLFYLSCDSPTLARDLGRLRAAGYDIARRQPFDLFPQTAHLETLVELVR